MPICEARQASKHIVQELYIMYIFFTYAIQVKSEYKILV